jgi:hypothetical protein
MKTTQRQFEALRITCAVSNLSFCKKDNIGWAARQNDSRNGEFFYAVTDTADTGEDAKGPASRLPPMFPALTPASTSAGSRERQ